MQPEMYSPQTGPHTGMSLKMKIVLAVSGVIIVVLFVVVGWLIVRVTNEGQGQVVYSSQKADENGLASGDAKDTGNGTDEMNLEGLVAPTQSGQSGQSSQSGSSSSNNSSAPPPAPGQPATASDPKPVRSQTLPNGLKIDEYAYGTGEKATKQGDTIAVHYVGYLTNGQVFDTSLKGEKKPFAFKLGTGQVIPGWDIGLQDMHVGALRRLTIPAALAYGAKGSPPSIPPNATLIFDVQLLAIQ